MRECSVSAMCCPASTVEGVNRLQSLRGNFSDKNLAGSGENYPVTESYALVIEKNSITLESYASLILSFFKKFQWSFYC